ncbi:hypothetical protein AYI68_g5703, partial [Smittium mucronatum]
MDLTSRLYFGNRLTRLEADTAGFVPKLADIAMFEAAAMAKAPASTPAFQ